MKKVFFIFSVFALTSVCAYSQGYATYTPQTSPTVTLPNQKSQSVQQTSQVTGYQYDSFSKKWYRIGLKLSIKEGIGRSDIVTVTALKQGNYWSNIQPLRAGSISDRESEFSYYVNLSSGTVYFNY